MCFPWSLDRYRALLRLQVRQMELDPRLQPRFDTSDVIQETFLRAHARHEQFRGTTEAEFIGWLRAILGNVVADEIDKARAACRDVAREQRLQEALAASSVRIEAYLVSRERSPPAEVERLEQLIRLADAIEQLPAVQREVFVRRRLLDRTVAEIASEMGRTERAVAGLLFRASQRLVELLRTP
jgi:RNA polymerase sigma-70 factor (ECF subfamily)